MRGHRCPGEGCGICARAIGEVETGRLVEQLGEQTPDYDGWQAAQNAFERDLDSFYG